MTKEKHIVFGLGLIEKMTDADLEASFTSDGKPLTAGEVRQYVKGLRDAGYSFFPCSCKELNTDGSCKGWTSSAKA